MMKFFRHWQDLGYLIIYVTGRPCMQLRKVGILSTEMSTQKQFMYF